MKTYAQIENRIVITIISPYQNESGEEVPIEERFTPDFVATLIDITDLDPMPENGWLYDGVHFSAPGSGPVDIVALADSARSQRDQLLRDNYDRGILMLQRMARMTTDSEQLIYLNGKIAELDQYAVDLQGVPEQSGFPLTINWPILPTA